MEQTNPDRELKESSGFFILIILFAVIAFFFWKM
jgi:hypothetical protein